MSQYTCRRFLLEFNIEAQKICTVLFEASMLNSSKTPTGILWHTLEKAFREPPTTTEICNNGSCFLSSCLGLNN